MFLSIFFLVHWSVQIDAWWTGNIPKATADWSSNLQKCYNRYTLQKTHRLHHCVHRACLGRRHSRHNIAPAITRSFSIMDDMTNFIKPKVSTWQRMDVSRRFVLLSLPKIASAYWWVKIRLRESTTYFSTPSRAVGSRTSRYQRRPVSVPLFDLYICDCSSLLNIRHRLGLGAAYARERGRGQCRVRSEKLISSSKRNPIGHESLLLIRMSK